MKQFCSSKSEQTVRTPTWLLRSVALTFGEIALDVAATAENAVAARFFDQAADGLTKNWIVAPDRVVWCNPPFRAIGPWVERAHYCAQNFGTDVVLLVLASPGANWWRAHVDGKAEVVFISPRIRFPGHDHSFTHDLALCHYGPTVPVGYRCSRLIPGKEQRI